MKHPLARAALYAAGAVVAFLILAAATVFFLLSRLDMRAEIERAVEQATGRDLTISGPVGVVFFPVLGLQAHDAKLANVAGGRAASLVAVEELDLGVDLMPLLRREVSVHELVLQRPTLSLEVSAEGAPNWILKPRAPPSPTPAPQGAPPPLTMHAMRIIDGAFEFYDARQRALWRLEGIDARSALDSLDKPTRILGSAVFNTERGGFDVELTTPRAMIEGRGVHVKAKLVGPLLNASFEGDGAAGSGQLAGQLQASGPSLRRVASWLRAPLQGGQGFEQFEVDGALAISGKSFAFTNASFALDALRGRGDFEVSILHEKPYVSGRLELLQADFNPYVSAAVAPAPAGAQTEAQPAAEPAAAPARALDVQAAPSEAKLDFASLSSFNCDLELTTNAMRMQRLAIDRALIGLVINEGYLAATMHELALYGGTGTGRLELDARTPDVRLVHSISVSGVDAQRFLSDAANLTAIEGKGEVSLDMRTHGETQSALIANASGSAHIEVISGALRGVDLGGISRTIQNAMDGTLLSPNARTAFNGFSANFALSHGVLASDTLSFNTPELTMRGLGLWDLNAQRLDVRLAPRSPRGGIVFPFAVRGPFAKLDVRSDIRDIVLRELQTRVRAVQNAQRATQ